MQACGRFLTPLQDDLQLTRCHPPHSGSATICVPGGFVCCTLPLSSVLESEFACHLLLPAGLHVESAGPSWEPLQAGKSDLWLVFLVRPLQELNGVGTKG